MLFEQVCVASRIGPRGDAQYESDEPDVRRLVKLNLLSGAEPGATLSFELCVAGTVGPPWKCVYGIRVPHVGWDPLNRVSVLVPVKVARLWGPGLFHVDCWEERGCMALVRGGQSLPTEAPRPLLICSEGSYYEAPEAVNVSAAGWVRNYGDLNLSDPKLKATVKRFGIGATIHANELDAIRAGTYNATWEKVLGRLEDHALSFASIVVLRGRTKAGQYAPCERVWYLLANAESNPGSSRAARCYFLPPKAYEYVRQTLFQDPLMKDSILRRLLSTNDQARPLDPQLCGFQAWGIFGPRRSVAVDAAASAEVTQNGTAAAEGDDDEAVCTGTRTWAERDAELRRNAIELSDDEDAPAPPQPQREPCRAEEQDTARVAAAPAAGATAVAARAPTIGRLERAALVAAPRTRSNVRRFAHRDWEDSLATWKARPADGATVETATRLVRLLLGKKQAYAFREPVDWQQLGLRDYPQIITRPMDLGSVLLKLNNGAYAAPPDFVADVRLVFENAKRYNGAGSMLHAYAAKLLQEFNHSLTRGARSMGNLRGWDES